MPKKLIILESPYAGNVEQNTIYAKRCMHDSLKRGEAPFLSHLLYTQCLEDTIPEDRKLGTEAGWAWIKKSDKTVVYEDYGISNGMKEGIQRAKKLKHKIEYRKIGENVKDKSSVINKIDYSLVDSLMDIFEFKRVKNRKNL